jgi:hypothetical protein
VRSILGNDRRPLFVRLGAATIIIAAVVSLATLSTRAEEVCHGCGCKCGPGFRLPNGHCASWAEHWRYTARGGYPSGTVDKLPIADKNAACPADDIVRKRKSH